MSGRFLSEQSQQDLRSDRSGYDAYARYDAVALGSMVS